MIDFGKQDDRRSTAICIRLAGSDTSAYDRHVQEDMRWRLCPERRRRTAEPAFVLYDMYQYRTSW